MGSGVPTAKQGLFITFEGMDGCGKTTQLHLLARRLRDAGRTVLETVEPGGTPIGEQIRRILLDNRNQELSPTAEFLLYFASRAQNVDQWIRPALARGDVVLCDRFTDSTMAYQGYGRAIGPETVLAVDRIACRGLKPDLTLLIDIDLETSLARARARNREASDPATQSMTRMDDQAAEFYHKVRDAYWRMAQAAPDRFRIVDGRGDVAAVESAVWSVVAPHV
jgi:dTMP kinase